MPNGCHHNSPRPKCAVKIRERGTSITNVHFVGSAARLQDFLRARSAGHVPPSVRFQVSLHLCNGDLDAKHFVQPIDATKMVEMANLITCSVSRPITWMHMPVPIDRFDEAFYAPLRNLQLGDGTELYLGLVHAQDVVEGIIRRMAQARKYVPTFGIASECGISRGRTANVAMEFIKTYAGAAAAR